MKKLFLIFSMVFLTLFAQDAFSSSSGGTSSSSGSSVNSNLPVPSNFQSSTFTSSSGGIGAGGFFGEVTSNVLTTFNSSINDAPWYSTIFPQSIAAFLCDIRRLFCGTLSIVITTVAIFIVGILILNQRMNWPWGIVIITATITLFNAEDLTGYVLKRTFNIVDLSVMPKICKCFPDLQWQYQYIDPCTGGYVGPGGIISSC